MPEPSAGSGQSLKSRIRPCSWGWRWLSRAMARVGMEELVGDVGQDSGAARGDGTFGDEL